MKKCLLLLLALLLMNFSSACKNKNHLEEEKMDSLDSSTESSKYSKTTTLHPVIFNFKITNENKSRVYFESSEPILASNSKGFTVSGKTISDITIKQKSTTGHYFTVSSAFDFWDNNTIRYEGGSNLKDTDDGKELYPFSLQYIQNKIIEPTTKNRTFYVDGNVGISGDGLTESSAFKTIQEGIIAIENETIPEGTTLWIKAYDYGNENITMRSNGTEDNPIKIIGYKSKPGDINKMYYTYAKGVGLDTSEMPTLTGSRGGIGINMQSNYVIWKNIQGRDYFRFFINEQGGVNEGIEGNIIDNCIGHTNVDYGDSNGNLLGFKGMASKRNRLINSIGVNTSMLGLSMGGYFSLVENCQVYADELVISSDYYMAIWGGNHIVRNNIVKRTGPNTHGGHGIALKSRSRDNNERYVWDSEHTLIEDNDVINIQQAVHLSHKETKNNVVRNVRITNPDAYSSVIGISFLGSSNNIAENLTYDSDKGEAIKFTASNEDLIYTYGANNNIVKNSVFAHGSVIVRVDEFDTARNIFDNKILNCTFFDFYYLEDNDAAKGKHTGNELINCIIDQCKILKANKGNPLYTAQSYSSFNDLGFSMPGGTDNIMSNPLFADQINFKPKNPKLKSGLPLSEVNYDRNKTEREEPPTMGAYELK